MLLSLNYDLLALIFYEVTESDHRALRSTCKALRRAHQYISDDYARSIYESYIHPSQGTLDEYKQFIAYGRFVFIPNVDNIREFTRPIINDICTSHEDFCLDETIDEIYHTLKRGIYRAMHPPHITIKCAWVWDDALFVLDHHNILYRNNKQIVEGVGFLTRISSNRYLIFDTNDIYLRDEFGKVMHCDKKPDDALFAGAYSISKKSGHIYRITLDGCVLQTGWSFPTGVIRFVQGLLEESTSLIVVTTQHQAFRVICCANKIVEVNGILEDVIDVVGCGSIFLFLNKEHTLISVTLDNSSFTFRNEEGTYKRLYVLGQHPRGVFHVLAYAHDGVDQLRVECSPLMITRTRLSQNYGWSYPLAHGTYTIVY